MWTNPADDPGGGLHDPPVQQPIVSQEKVAEYANTLNKMKERVKRNQVKAEGGADIRAGRKLDTPSSEKLNLLRQEMEQKKAKLAESRKNQKGVEEIVTQIKAQLDDSQRLFNQTPLNISLIEDRVEYSANTTSQELYQILLNKDKKLDDLTGKISKLEANVLDLQENLKEKDSVIDARTKAITLMSENLSKKGKSTLDALDETKEQMRKMQENFVSMEEDMKEENFKLLRELDLKNVQLFDLKAKFNQTPVKIEETSEKHEAEIKNLLNQIAELRKQLEENSHKSDDVDVSLNPEIEKLKKQLDESNKSMIKIKAQHKSKVKDLNKKIDAFKKIGDANVAVVQLEAENCKLSQRIAELEEEKGQMQLNMVESIKESEDSEKIHALELKISEQLELIKQFEVDAENKSKEILELTSLQSERIKSDLALAQHEEQLEKLEKEHNLALEKLEDENKSLMENIESLKKEKLELSNKLDAYMQENIELIDKLEKLSAEKVSSAESIEIVENLTKLEMEAYQKSLIGKSSEHLDETDLSVSANQLTEGTSELLQKIELFEVERHEVMDKMESLAAENNHLVGRIKELEESSSIENVKKLESEAISDEQNNQVIMKIETLTQENNELLLKLREIENNHEVLVETYEHLQTEKEELDDKIERFLSSKKSYEEKIVGLESEIERLKSQSSNDDVEEYKAFVEIQKQEIRELKVELLSNSKVKEFEYALADLDGKWKELENDKSVYENKLREEKQEFERKTLQFEATLKEYSEEIDAYKSVIEDNKQELIKSANTINNYEVQLTVKLSEIEECHNEINSLNSIVTDLNMAIATLEEENRNALEKFKDVDEMTAELERLKGDTQEYDSEFEGLNANISELNNKLLESKTLLNVKDDELETMKRLNEETVSRNKRLEAAIKEKDESFRKVCEDLRVKCEALQTKFEENSCEPLQIRIAELEKKNKEQLEKMKKLAANLKKKSGEYTQLEKKNQKDVAEKNEKIELLVQQLQEVEAEFSKMQKHNEENANAVSMNKQLQEELQHNLSQIREVQNVSKQYEMRINNLSQELNSLKSNDQQASTVALETKIFELEMYLESQENEYKEKLADLEENKINLKVSVEELENGVAELNGLLRSKENSLEELMQNKNLLETRCEELLNSENAARGRLEMLLNENQELIQENQVLAERVEAMKTDLLANESELKRLSAIEDKLASLENEKSDLNKIVNNMDNELKKARSDLASSKGDRDRNESELQEQLEQFASERKVLMEQCELARDQLQLLENQRNEYEQEIGNLNRKLDQQQVDFDRHMDEFRALVLEHNRALSDLDALRVEASSNNFEVELEKVRQENSELKASLQAIEAKCDVEKEKIDLQKSIESEAVNVTQSTPLFTWSEPKHDPFAFIAEQTQSQEVQMNPQQQNSEEEMQRKIKTLEFMLFSVEKEKDAALLQCHELSNELTRLIYERQQLSEVESQILPSVETTVEQSQSWAGLVPQQAVEVQEEICVAKSAYVCYPENDDGWGCGTEEAELEQKHLEQNESSTNQFRERIAVLEMERDNHLEEIKQSQIKCGKLIKKLKEFKTKNEQLEAKLKADDFGGLNDAIVDELKLQISSLEKKTKEVNLELDKEKHDKDNLAKKLEVLASANERLVEMKEKQDIEMMGWQQRNRELAVKLEKIEWGDSEIVEHKTVEQSTEPNSEIEKLNEIIKDLTLDNEELQALLEEQRNIRLSEEKTKSINVEYDNLLAEKEKKLSEVSQQLQTNYSEKTQLEANILENHIIIETLTQQLTKISEEITNLKEGEVASSIEIKQKLDELESEKLQYYNETILLKTELETFKATLSLAESSKIELQQSLEQTVSTNQNLTGKIEEATSMLETERNSNDILKNQLQELQNLLDLQKSGNQQELDEELRNVREALNGEIIEKETLMEMLENVRTDLQQALEQQNAANVENVRLKEELENLHADVRSSQGVLELHSEDKIKFHEEITQLKSELETKTIEYQNALTQLAQEWSLQVDQRGNDVAVSWKQHVDMRESEFAEAQQKSQKEIADLKEQCANLLMQNEELRKNVDEEMKVEVDRIAALQAINTEKQQKIDELTWLVDELTVKSEAALKELDSKQQKIDILVEASGELTALQTEIEAKNVDITSLQQTLQNITNERENLLTELRNVVDEKENLSRDLQNAIDENEVLSKEVQSKVDLLSSLQEKDTTDEKTVKNLQLELKEKENELRENLLFLDDLKNQMAQYKVKLSALEGESSEKSYRIDELNGKLEGLQIESGNSAALQQQLHECAEHLNASNMQLQEKSLHLVALTQEVENYRSLGEHVQERDAEIGRLNELLREKEREFAYTLTNSQLENQSLLSDRLQELETLQRRLHDADVKYEEMVTAKESEIELYRQQFEMYQQSSERDKNLFSDLHVELQTKNDRCSVLERLTTENELQLQDLKNIIENQVLKISEMEKEVYEKSTNYDALIAQLNNMQELKSSQPQLQQQLDSSGGDGELDNVMRELDLALYLLHQRDVRCEQLTMELMQLLEERDTLQLRLSNAIREREELRGFKSEQGDGAGKVTVESTSVASSTGAIPKSKAIILGATGTELAAEATESLHTAESLADKLSELKTVGYRKDKTIVDEQEHRRLQQISFIQQHKDEVAKLPAEAAARLVDANYTLSRDVQSPSKVLLNWLRGRSTPKQHNI